MEEQLIIPAQYNGPPDSGNGGYSCGALGVLVDGPAKIRLSSPPPLDTSMTVHRLDGGAVELRRDDELVATAIPQSVKLNIPVAPSLEQAEQASRDFAGTKNHAFPSCYVCGPERGPCDGMRLFAGPVKDSPIYACVWSPTRDQLNEHGNVRDEIVWAALDCPGYFAAFRQELRPALLGELTADLIDVVDGSQDHVVFAWSISHSGRKHVVGTAVADAEGSIRAVGHATWIEMRA